MEQFPAVYVDCFLKGFPFGPIAPLNHAAVFLCSKTIRTGHCPGKEDAWNTSTAARLTERRWKENEQQLWKNTAQTGTGWSETAEDPWEDPDTVRADPLSALSAKLCLDSEFHSCVIHEEILLQGIAVTRELVPLKGNFRPILQGLLGGLRLSNPLGPAEGDIWNGGSSSIKPWESL